MNVPGWSDNYIDATNEIIGGSGDTIIEGGSNNISDYLYVTSNSNVYLNNPNTNGEIRIKVKNNDGNPAYSQDHRVRINKDGKLQLYHVYNPLIPNYPSGWYDITDEVIGLKFNSDLQQVEITALGATVAVIQGQITDIYATLTTILTALGSVNNSLEFTQDLLYENNVLNQNHWQIQRNRDNFNSLLEDYVGTSTTNGVRQRAIENRSFIANSVSSITGIYGLGLQIGVPVVAGLIGALYAIQEDRTIYNASSNISNINFEITTEQRRRLLDSNLITSTSNVINLASNLSNMSLQQGFINSSNNNSQLIPSIKSNKILLGNITTPNSSYQMEMTGDLNLNELWVNSTSLTSLLNQKQNNMSATQPIFITTANIGLNYDSSLTKIGNNLSVAPATASKWTTSGTNIYNNNTGNVGIGTNNPQEKLHLHSSTASTATYIRFTNAQSGVTSTDGVYMGLDDQNPYTFTINSRTATGRIQMRTGDTTRATLKSNGCFGLGITDPQQLLSVAGKIESTNGNNDKIYFSYDDTNNYRHRIYANHDSGASDNNYIQFYNWRYGQSATTIGDKSVAIFHNKFTKFDGNRYFWINDRTIDWGTNDFTSTPLSIFNQTASSSTVLNDPQRVLSLARQGTSGQTYGQTATFKLCRWENSGTNSRTRLDLDLSDGGNTDTNIMTMRSDGKVGIGFQVPIQRLSVNGAGEFTSANGNKIIFSYSGNDYKHRIYTQHNANADVSNHFDFYTWRLGQGVNDDGDRLCLRLSATHTHFPANFNKYFWINDEIGDRNVYSHQTTPLCVFQQTASSSTVLNDPQPVFTLARKGTVNQAFGNRATFKLSRYEHDASYGSRTRLDLDLSHSAYDDVNVARFYSDGTFQTKQITALSTNSLNIWGGTNGNLTFSTGNPAGEVMRINSAGNIGINTTAPRTKLDIYSGSLTLRASGESGSTYLYMGTPNDTNNDALKCALICEGLGTYSRSKFHISLDKNANNSTTYNASLTNGVQFTLKYNGYGAFGNKNPFEDAVAPNSFQLIHLGNSTIANVCDYNLVIHKSQGNGNTRHFAIGYDDQFYETIGDLGGNNTASYWYSHLSMSYGAPDYSIQLFPNGNVNVYGNLYQGSDIKIKKDIKTIDNALWKVKQLRGVYYTHVIEGTRNIGLIAQEVEGVIPEVVSYDERSYKKNVAYPNLVALLVNAIKELEEALSKQSATINNLINRIDLLEKKNAL